MLLLLPLLIVLDHEPKLLFRLAKHSSEVHLVAMVEPVSVLFANNFRECRLVGLLSGLLLQGLLHGSNGDLWPTFIPLEKLLLAQDTTTSSKVSELLLLELLALEVEQAEGIFLPRLRLDDQSTPENMIQFLIRCTRKLLNLLTLASFRYSKKAHYLS